MIYVIGKKNQNLTLQLTEKALEISEVAAEMAVRLSASLLLVISDLRKVNKHKLLLKNLF